MHLFKYISFLYKVRGLKQIITIYRIV